MVSWTGDAIQTDADRVRIHDMFIGVLPDGVTFPGNATEGIIVTGNDTEIRGNVIGGSGNAAIGLNGTSTGTIVAGNHLGTDRTGTVDLGNLQGVWSDTTGGGNEIRDNNQLGLDLVGGTENPAGVTANDAGDADTGPNGLLNYPVMTSSALTGTVVDLTYTLDVPAGTYRVEFFANPGGADPSGHGEGEQFLSAATISHPGGGARTFTHSVAGGIGSVITATTTEDLGGGAYGATSEFAANVVIADPAADRIADESVRRSDLTGRGGFLRFGREQTGAARPWTVSSAQTRSGGFAAAAPQVDGPGETAWLTAMGPDEPGMVFRSWWWVSSTTLDIVAGTRTGAVATDQYETASSVDGFNLAQRSGASVTQDAVPAGTPDTGRWVQIEIWTDQNGDSRVLVDGIEVIGWTPQGSALASGSVGLRAGGVPVGEAWYVDDARGRRLVTPEPVTTLGPLDRD